MLTFDQAKAVYRQAIDAGAREAEGVAWWTEVAEEVRAVVDAADNAAAAAVIAWWHPDWRAVGDSPTQAALRLRRTAARLERQAVRGAGRRGAS